jgi:hypothetical protein
MENKEIGRDSGWGKGGWFGDLATAKKKEIIFFYLKNPTY